VAHGWNIDIGRSADALDLVRLSSEGLERFGADAGLRCTLLGPEGPEHSGSSDPGWTETQDLHLSGLALCDQGVGVPPVF
jgi:hypothetical protein